MDNDTRAALVEAREALKLARLPVDGVCTSTREGITHQWVLDHNGRIDQAVARLDALLLATPGGTGEVLATVTGEVVQIAPAGSDWVLIGAAHWSRIDLPRWPGAHLAQRVRIEVYAEPAVPGEGKEGGR